MHFLFLFFFNLNICNILLLNVFQYTFKKSTYTDLDPDYKLYLLERSFLTFRASLEAGEWIRGLHIHSQVRGGHVRQL